MNMPNCGSVVKNKKMKASGICGGRKSGRGKSGDDRTSAGGGCGGKSLLSKTAYFYLFSILAFKSLLILLFQTSESLYFH